MTRRTKLILGGAVVGMLAGGALLAENITLTTTYPAPRGVYDELQANTFKDYNGGGNPNQWVVDPSGSSTVNNVAVQGTTTTNEIIVTGTGNPATDKGIKLGGVRRNSWPTGTARLEWFNLHGVTPVACPTGWTEILQDCDGPGHKLEEDSCQELSGPYLLCFTNQ